MVYNSNYSGQRVDELLDKIDNDNVGTVDSEITEHSQNPVTSEAIFKALKETDGKLTELESEIKSEKYSFEHTFFRSTEEGKYLRYPIKAGSRYKITNHRSTAINLYSKNVIGGDVVEELSANISANSSKIVIPTLDANYFYSNWDVTVDIQNLDNDINKLNEDVEDVNNKVVEVSLRADKNSDGIIEAYSKSDIVIEKKIISDGSNSSKGVELSSAHFKKGQVLEISTTSSDEITIVAKGEDGTLYGWGNMTVGTTVTKTLGVDIVYIGLLGATSTIGNEWIVSIKKFSEYVDLTAEIEKNNTALKMLEKRNSTNTDAILASYNLEDIVIEKKIISDGSNSSKGVELSSAHFKKGQVLEISTTSSDEITIVAKGEDGTLYGWGNMTVGTTVTKTLGVDIVYIGLLGATSTIGNEWIVSIKKSSNAIDLEPSTNSENLVKSGGVKGDIISRDLVTTHTFFRSTEEGKYLRYPIKAGSRYKITNHRSTAINLYSKNVIGGDVVEELSANISANSSKIVIPTLDANYFYSNWDVTVDIQNLDNDINNLNKIATIQPLVSFDKEDGIDTSVADIFDKFNFASGMYQADVMEQLYREYDKLVALFPDYITKYDPMATSEISQIVDVDGKSYSIIVKPMADVLNAMTEKGFADYPEYANGITSPISRTFEVGDGTSYNVTYDVTPKYRTYVYRFNNVNETYTINNKKKVLINCGTHGNEKMSPFATYAIAEKLAYAKDYNSFMLRSAFDIYIVPTLNGYGSIHTRYSNGNWVNINRNMPNAQLFSLVYTQDLQEPRDPLGCSFSGATAGNQFESNLIAELSNYINPHLAIDAHNYGTAPQQFYVNWAWNNDYKELVLQSCFDVCYELIKSMPNYFGNQYQLFLRDGSLENPKSNSIGNYFAYKGIPLSFTIEVSHRINYINGVYDNTGTGTYTKDSAIVAEFTLRKQLLNYCEWLLKHL